VSRTSRLQDPRNVDAPIDSFDEMTSAGPRKWRVPPVGISDFAVSKCTRSLSSGFAICRIPICRWPFPCRNFSRVPGFTPRVRERWTVLIPPRDIATCDAPLTQCVCQLETPNAEMPTGATMFATCPDKRTAEILSLYRVSRFRELRSPVAMVFENRELRYADVTMLGSAATCPLRWTAHKSSRDFAISRIGVLECNPLLVQLPITDFAMREDRRLTIFLDPTVQNDS
jgi:hypothetical protein